MKSSFVKCFVAFMATSISVLAADNPRHLDLGPEISSLETLSQNWSNEEANRFYNIPQGSRLVPYTWFLHLERPDSEESFRHADHIREMGYIPRLPDPQNIDGLPVGFIKDAPYDDGTPGLGMTCAACHTRQLNHNGKAILVDGGPGMGNLELFLKRLAASLHSTAIDPAKFERFSLAVLPSGSTDDDKVALRASLKSIAEARTGYNERNLPQVGQPPFGHGRVDAFGAIFNEVSVTFLNVPGNWQPANAPVSYPCLWDTPQHDSVQWNGAAENKKSPLGKILFGTSDVGAIGRNSGEVLGVFGSAKINEHEFLVPRHYASTVNKENLIEIEESLKNLWSPEWPQQILGTIDSELTVKGEALFKQHCSQCHASVDRQNPTRTIVAHISSEGTDETMLRNFGRNAETGVLAGRKKTLLGGERFAHKEPVGVILKHVVERVILSPNLVPGAWPTALAAAANNPLDAVDELNPGYRMTATITLGNKQLIGQFDSLQSQGQSLTIAGGQFHLMDVGRNVFEEGKGQDLFDLRSAATTSSAVEKLEKVVSSGVLDIPASGNEQSKAKLENAVAKVGYKARPLNGIWATAPYLHNGSVPNLAELLKRSTDRVKSFHVDPGEYDAKNIGYRDDPSQPAFDTTLVGNSNAGHEYGTELTDGEKRELIEYLKSL